jgi:transmembrane sensor
MKPTSNNHEEELKKAERIAYLIAGHLRNTLSADESDELDEWLNESDENLELFEKLTDEENIEAGVQQYLDIEGRKADALQKLKQEIGGERKSRRRFWPYLAAACVVVVAVSTYLYRTNEKQETRETPGVAEKPKDINPGSDKAVLVLADGRSVILDAQSDGVLDNNDGVKVTKHDGGGLSYTSSDAIPLTFHTLSTPRGGKYSVRLPDGTRVWLNAASTLHYPTSFTGAANREVELKGEAYFEVAKDAAHPFRVRVDDKAGVEVLGTQFNVNAYAEARVVLVEGKVKVGGRESGGGSRESGIGNGQLAMGNGQKNNGQWAMDNWQGVELRPGEMGEIGAGGEVKVSAADVAEAIAWKEGRFVFRNADIRSIGEEIQRWYDVEVGYEGAIKQHFNTEMRRDLPLAKLLDGLEGTMQVHFELEGRKLTIKP